MDEFVEAIVAAAKSQGYKIEQSYNGVQIDFGNKKLHQGHLEKLFPDILSANANIPFTDRKGRSW
jgi:hypothetical protein